MECVPTAREEIVNAAAPDESSVAEPMLVASSRNVTVPVGVVAVELTTTLNVTAWPSTDGFLEESRAVFVSSGQEEIEVELDEVLPLLPLVTAKSRGRAVTTIDVVAMQPWLSVSVRVKLSVRG